MTLVSRPDGLRICLCKTCFANEDGKYCQHKLQYNDERGNCATYRSKEETNKMFAYLKNSMGIDILKDDRLEENNDK